MWAIGVKFIRGVCVATDTGQWDEAEWPPHPARLFMALAASYFETLKPEAESDDDVLRRNALQWLESKKNAAPGARVVSGNTRSGYCFRSRQ